MRVMVVNQSEELRQVLQYVAEQGVDMEIVGETTKVDGLAKQLEQVRPEWLFLLQDEYKRLGNVVSHVIQANPDLRVILLTTDGEHIRYQKDEAWRTEVETWPEYSLSDFLYMLKETSPSPVAVKSIENIGEMAPPKFVGASGRS